MQLLNDRSLLIEIYIQTSHFADFSALSVQFFSPSFLTVSVPLARKIVFELRTKSYVKENMHSREQTVWLEGCAKFVFYTP